MSEEKVQVALGDDYYTGAYFSEAGSTDYEIPWSQLERWKAAEAAWEAMQREIEQVMAEQRESVRLRRAQRPESALPGAIQEAYGEVILRHLQTEPLWKRSEAK